MILQTIMTLPPKTTMMTRAVIQDFLASKPISQASKQSYAYDLEQFMSLVEGRINDTSLLYYQAFLTSLTVSAQKRKHSAVNQFLLYLYETGDLERYYRLKAVRETMPVAKSYEVLDLDFLTADSPHREGRLVASFLGLMGLTLKEMSELTGEAIDSDFKILKVSRNGHVRILPLPELILQQLPQLAKEAYLFGGQKPYSRQWFFLQLKAYLDSQGLAQLTAQALRQQFILHQIADGQSAFALAKQLGLKSTQTLEKYFN